MKNWTILILFLFILTNTSAQIIGGEEKFTDITTFKGKVVFVKELGKYENAYPKLKEWAKNNYAKDPFNSSVSYDDRKNHIVAKSRAELILPPNNKGKREKIIMKFRVDAFVTDKTCILEITNISFINDAKENGNTLPQKINAEKLITDEILQIDDTNQKTRINTKKNVIYFFNELADNLQNALAQ